MTPNSAASCSWSPETKYDRPGLTCISLQGNKKAYFVANGNPCELGDALPSEPLGGSVNDQLDPIMFGLIGTSAKLGAYVWRTLVVMLLATFMAGGSACAEGPGKTKVRLVAVDQGTSIRISGWVTVPARVANARDRRFVVLFSLNGDGNHERFRVPLNHQRHFAVVHTTKLTGVLKLQTHVSECNVLEQRRNLCLCREHRRNTS